MSMEELKYFFSYSRKDSEFVLQLAKELRAVGANLWLDQLDVVGGQHWDRTVEKALKICKGMIAVLSPESVASDNVMDEVSYALDKGKLVVPVIIRSCEIPLRLRRLQHIDFAADYDTGFSQLLRALGIEQPIQTLESAATQEPVVQDSTAPVEAKPTEHLVHEKQASQEVKEPIPDELDHPKPTDLETQKAGSKRQKIKVLAAVCIFTLITIISIGVFLRDRRNTNQSKRTEETPEKKSGTVVAKSNQTGAKFEHIGRFHSTFTKFYDEPDVISKGPITRIKVCYGDKYIHGLQLCYGGHDGKMHGFCDESFGLKFEPFDVPNGHLIVRVKGVIAGDYVGQLQFETDRGTNSKLFGGNQTPTEKFMDEDPNGLPLRTISGWANLRRHENLSRAITSLTFHFGY